MIARLLARFANRLPHKLYGDESPYLLRAAVFGKLTAGSRVNGYLHHFFRGDSDEAHHSHPWWCFAIVLSGGYLEERVELSTGEKRRRWLRRGSVNFLRASTFHRLVAVEPRTWTLAICGRRTRAWHFRHPDGSLVDAATEYALRGNWVDDGSGRKVEPTEVRLEVKRDANGVELRYNVDPTNEPSVWRS